VIALVDYGAGNLTSVRKAFAALDADISVPASPADLERASAVVVPGVGHFAATSALGPDWTSAIRSSVERGRPLLGICLGMQWLFEGSDEATDCPGLGVLAGRCRRLSGVDAAGHALKVPHVGWNSLALQRDAPIVAGVAQGSQVYFTHSFMAPVTDDTVAVTEHGEPFAAIVEHGRISGVQFHPEKSGDVGLAILRNFLRHAL
jgi:imidazole glycerol-phosphate synthase subunit HisH